MRYRWNERKKFICTHCIFNKNNNKLDNYTDCIYTHSPAKDKCDNFKPIEDFKKTDKRFPIAFFVLLLLLIFGLAITLDLMPLLIISIPFLFYMVLGVLLPH
ncbi:MAG: hypothetical protein OH319_02520 [Candidatus Parvarchaeota archaeon]|nr:hypothetical protein [Candidatus Jingweiarchaeum tengchongense]MCW1300040.1 hypothetical protein [Candidatus Jingweiarchaeum tengchongense]MCW1304821.1 hypothetical protein [Candidatus Jingweiarchaeum tengchongense]MCW1305411.1 hypothetical protein [Candidatus Jingweiarchaeum tengchongense]